MAVITTGIFFNSNNKVIIGNGPVAVQYTPVWSTSSGNIGSYTSAIPMSYQFLADDANNDLLTYSLVSGSLPSGLTLSPTGVLSGTPINVVAQAPLTDWKILGTSIGNGHWDVTGANASVQQSAIDIGYSITTSNGNIIFQSKAKDAPFVSADSTFVPTINQSYQITYKVKKLTAATNGVNSFIKPAFDTYYANGTLNVPALGTVVTGTGYTSSITVTNWSGGTTTYNNVNAYDTSTWQVGTVYEVSSIWTPATSDLARGRIRINRSYPDTVGPDYANAAIHDYSDAVFEISSQNVTYVTNPLITYSFTINVSDSYTTAQRSFSMTVQ